MRFSRGVSINATSQVLYALLAVGIDVIVSRELGPDGKGAYALFIVLNGIMVLIANLGLGQAAIFHVGQKTYTATTIANNLFSVSFLLGILMAALIVILLLSCGGTILGGVPSHLLPVIAILTPLTLSRMYAGHFFVAVQDFMWYNGLRLLDLGICFVLIGAFFLCGGGLSEVVSAIVISTILSTTVGWYQIHRRVAGLRLEIQPDLVLRLISYGLRPYLTTLIAYLTLRVDRLFVALFLNVEQVGIYSVAVAVAELSMVATNAITPVLFAQISTLDSRAATQLTGRVTRITMTFGVLVAGLFLVFGSSVISALFGAQFFDAGAILWILLPGVLMYNLQQILVNDFAGRGRPEIGIYACLPGLVFMLAGDVLLIPSWGLEGAALVSSMSYAVSALILLGMYLRTSHQTLLQVFWITREDLLIVGQLLNRASASL